MQIVLCPIQLIRKGVGNSLIFKVKYSKLAFALFLEKKVKTISNLILQIKWIGIFTRGVINIRFYGNGFTKTLLQYVY